MSWNCATWHLHDSIWILLRKSWWWLQIKHLWGINDCPKDSFMFQFVASQTRRKPLLLPALFLKKIRDKMSRHFGVTIEDYSQVFSTTYSLMGSYSLMIEIRWQVSCVSDGVVYSLGKQKRNLYSSSSIKSAFCWFVVVLDFFFSRSFFVGKLKNL